MVKVTFVSSFQPALGGGETLEIDAKTLRQLARTLVAKYPGMQEHFDDGIAFAVDGEIYRDNWDIEIPKGSEVFLMPRIRGG